MISSTVRRGVVAITVAGMVLAGCTADPDKKVGATPLPTESVTGKTVCGFVSEQSVVTAIGTSKFSIQGAKTDLRGNNRNQDGSKLNQAGCSVYTNDSPLKALDISVTQIGGVARWDNLVPSKLAGGGVEFVFPAGEGMGFATSKNDLDEAATAHLIVGDWHYFVSIHPRVDGRDAIQDAVALIRQTVTQLGLPTTGKLPRPTATPGG
ncbi:hypothetical protein GCM10009534_49420 [Kribbella sandramycini]